MSRNKLKSLQLAVTVLSLAGLVGCGFEIAGRDQIGVHLAPDAAAPDAIEPDTAEPDQDGDGVPDAVDLCDGTWDPTNLDADGDGAGDVCDECPFVYGNKPCPSTWNADALAGRWMAWRFTATAVGSSGPLLRDFVAVEPLEVGKAGFAVKLGAELQSIGAGSITPEGLVWLQLGGAGVPAGTFQGVASRLGDKLFLQRVAEGVAGDEVLVLLRQPTGGLDAHLKALPPTKDEPYVLTGMLLTEGSDGASAAGLLQTVQFGEPVVNALPFTLGEEGGLEPDRIALLQEGLTGSLGLDVTNLAIKLPQPEKVTLPLKITAETGGLVTLAAEADVTLEGAFSYFGEFALFLGRKTLAGVNLTFVVALQRVHRNPAAPEDLGLPFYRLGVSSATAGDRVRSALVDPNGAPSLDVLDLVARGQGFGAIAPALCLAEAPAYWSFQASRNPHGHAIEDVCVGTGADGTGAVKGFAHAWMGAVTWGNFPTLADVGLGLFSAHADLYVTLKAQPGLVFYARAPQNLGGVFDHYDADLDGYASVGGTSLTDCAPLLGVLNRDKCPCAIAKKESEDGCP